MIIEDRYATATNGEREQRRHMRRIIQDFDPTLQPERFDAAAIGDLIDLAFHVIREWTREECMAETPYKQYTIRTWYEPPYIKWSYAIIETHSGKEANAGSHEYPSELDAIDAAREEIDQNFYNDQPTS